MKKIEEYVRSIPDFPQEGIIFRDVTSVLEDADGMHLAIDTMQDLVKDLEFDVVVGAESRGFIFGAPIAYNLHKPFALIRKKGKLPCETVSQEYSLEYDKNPIEGIKTRIKSYDSLVRKIRRKNIPMSLASIEENIKDIAGVRVICSFPEDIYELADSFLKQDDIVLIEKKDYIKNPKPSGYRSLHLIVQVPIFLQKNKKMVNVEVQFRTIAMDFWASLEHKLRYKKDIPEDQAQQLQEELLACATQSAQLDERMQEIRNQLVSKFGE